ncbi:MAG TPA: FxLYD domain-containing protein [Gemmatimonadales bacterium]|nr:FxLYD domain-containing protein [Gemmatimonadales bacterium]
MRPSAVVALSLALPVLAAAQAKPACDLSPNFFRLNSAPLNLHLAEEKPDQRDRMLAGVKDVAERTLAEHQDNAVAWYYLARYYQESHNPWGADTAFAHTEKLVPQCADTLVQFRKSAWNDAFTAGMTAWQGGKTDSAVILLQLSRRLMPRNPRADFQLGQLYAGANSTDSAITYLNLGAQLAGTDTAYGDARHDALGTAARLALARAQGDPVIARSMQVRQSLDSLGRYLQNDSILLAHRLAQSASRHSRGARLSPTDQQAFATDSTQLSQSLSNDRALRTSLLARAAGDTTALKAAYAPAVTAYQALLAAYPASLDAAVNLAAIFSQSGHPEMAATALDPVVAHPDLIDQNAALEAAQRMGSGGLGAAALKLYGMLLKANPNNRGALAGQADALLRMHDAGAVAPALKVMALDPSNQLATRALGQAYGVAGQADSAKKYLARADTGLAVDISVTQFQPDSAGADLSGVASNLKGAPSAPLHLTIDFLNAAGAVVTTQTTQVAPIAPQGSAQFEVKATGKGIVAWRYKLS